MRWILMGMVAAGLGCAHHPDERARVLMTPIVEEKPVPKAIERTVELGRSVEGRAIEAVIFGDGADVTLVLGAIHGNEGSTAVVTRSLVEYLRQQPEVLAGRTVAVVPVANPDGLARKLRTNKRLVDLNRNFPAANWAKTRRGIYFGGNEAASEPETVGLMKLFDQLRPARVVSIHSMEKPCNNYDGPGRALAEAMSRQNGYAVKDNIGYATPGSFGSWVGIDRGVPIITLELPRTLAGDKAWEQNRQALLAVIQEKKSVASRQ